MKNNQWGVIVVGIAVVVAVIYAANQYASVNRSRIELEGAKALQQQGTQDALVQANQTNQALLSQCLNNVDQSLQKVVSDPKFKNMSNQDAQTLLAFVSKEKDDCNKKYPVK